MNIKKVVNRTLMSNRSSHRNNKTIIFADIRTSNSTHHLLYDKSHSKTRRTTIIIYIPFSILKQILASLACSKRSDSGERCEVKKAMKSRGGLGREVRERL